ncbi:MAG: segregation/condensation protein A [Firmicutes bacterium]|nr:segregation/condensation protein A [Bacillota bacterium]
MSYNVQLEIFSGPMDLLLHLIQKNEMSIYDIPIARITEQYLEYLATLQELDVDIASDFLVMAATLIHMKARLLLPKAPPAEGEESEEEELDPREELARRLMEYKKYKEASNLLRALGESQNLVWTRDILLEAAGQPPSQAEAFPALEGVSLDDLVAALKNVLAGLTETEETSYRVPKERFSIRQKMRDILRLLRQERRLSFQQLFGSHRSRTEVVVSFLALLELIRLGLAAARQSLSFGAIELFYVERTRKKGGAGH